MSETQHNPCENALRTLQPASTKALEEVLQKSLRTGKLRSIRENAKMLSDGDFPHFDPAEVEKLAHIKHN